MSRRFQKKRAYAHVTRVTRKQRGETHLSGVLGPQNDFSILRENPHSGDFNGCGTAFVPVPARETLLKPLAFAPPLPKPSETPDSTGKVPKQAPRGIQDGPRARLSLRQRRQRRLRQAPGFSATGRSSAGKI